MIECFNVTPAFSNSWKFGLDSSALDNTVYEDTKSILVSVGNNVYRKKINKSNNILTWLRAVLLLDEFQLNYSAYLHRRTGKHIWSKHVRHRCPVCEAKHNLKSISCISESLYNSLIIYRVDNPRWSNIFHSVCFNNNRLYWTVQKEHIRVIYT